MLWGMIDVCYHQTIYMFVSVYFDFHLDSLEDGARLRCCARVGMFYGVILLNVDYVIL